MNSSILKILLSIPKTLYFNFRYFPLKTAIHLPFFISYDTKIKIGKGAQIIFQCKQVKSAQIRYGFHHVPICSEMDKTCLEIKKNGILELRGTAHIGKGTRIVLFPNAKLIIGDNFIVSSSSQINCFDSIVFGNDVLFSWDCLVMDSDTHSILNMNGEATNNKNGITFGDKIWIGCRSTILKGTIIPSNTVIGACSLVSGTKFEESSIIAGNPAKSIKKIGGWAI